MGQNASKRYATDDPELQKFLQTVMGNKKAARLFWSCLLEDECLPTSFLEGMNTTNVSTDDVHFGEIGRVIDPELTCRLDNYCGRLCISRFSALVSAFAVLVEKYSSTSSFWISHNYGVTGASHRILKYPVTRMELVRDDSTVSFKDLCTSQDDLIQKSSYHLCIRELPADHRIERCLGVFLLDPITGHTMEMLAADLKDFQLPLVVELGARGEIILRLHYNSSKVSPDFAARFLSQLLYTLDQCISQADVEDVRSVPTVPPDQLIELLDQSVFQLPFESNIDFPELGSTLDNLIRKQAAATPDAIALQNASSDQSIRMTYAELVQRAERLRDRIFTSKCFIQGNSRIAILLNRGMNQIVAVLAILMAGCAYVPLDPINHPPERIDYILRDSGAVGIITDPSVTVARSFHSKLPCIEIESEGEEMFERPEQEARSVATDIAYVIYTSGSTGKPKGVQVPHKGIVNDIFCVYKNFMDSDPRIIKNVLFSTNLCFDAHVDEVFLPLVFGGSITCLDTNIAQTVLRKEWGLSFVQSTPSVLQVVDIPDSVRCVLIGGETLTKSTLEKVFKPDRIVLNGYGPTETTNESSIHVVRSTDDYKSIGKPIWNTQFYLMDQSGKNFVPKHAWGELFIGGVGVTRGYCNLPDLNSRVFNQLPTGQFVYKTGDIVRINASGDLEFRGRSSSCSQIKLRGYRIELGEIQYAILSSNPDIKEAHVCGSKIGESEQIVAYVVGDSTGLKYGQLPEYMKPSVIVPMTSLPRNISGKLDVKLLPYPSSSTKKSSFKSDVMERVARAFQETVGSESLSIDNNTNFFSVGGNSLNVVVLRNKIQQSFDREDIKLQMLFQLQTVEKISQYLEDLIGGSVKYSHDSVIVPLGDHSNTGSFIPLFCVHAAGGQVHTYSSLASSLSGVASFYAIQDPSLSSGSDHRLNSFESMGAFYAKRINEFYSGDRPIFLSGHSSGGSIAFETARSLVSDFGRSVGCVFMIDTDCPIPSADSHSVIDRIDELRYYLYSGWKEGLVEDYMNAMKTVSDANGGKTWQLLKAILPTKRSTSTRWSSDLLEMISLLSHHLQIEKRYDPLRCSAPVEFPIVLFRPSAEDEKGDSRWKEATRNKLIVVDIPNANHYTVIREPAVRIIATVIQHVFATATTTRARE